jgi:predicted enzyme related to lactoylglutathione lyase
MEGHEPWRQEAGPTVFMPFAKTSDYFPADKQWMINFRVPDLDALLKRLRQADIAIVTNAAWDTPETGRFARVYDPEGNPIELWEPPIE